MEVGQNLRPENIFESWQVDYESGIPVYRQIINQVSAAVATGALQTGGQLPTIRALCQRLQINPNTVAKAYRELELKGVIASERGAGSFITAAPPTPTAREKKERFKDLYQRLLADAAGNGLTEKDVLQFIKKRSA